MNHDYDKQGRDDRLANQVIERLEAIRRRSQGAYDEALVLLNTARYPSSSFKIRKLAYHQLMGMDTLLAGYEGKLSADLNPVLNTSMRPVLSIATVRQPFSLKRSDGVVQPCFLGNDGAEKAFTFLPANKTGVPSSNVALSIFAHAVAAGEQPMISQRSDTEVFVRHFDLVTTGGGADAKIRRVYLNSAGALQTAYLKDAAGVDITLTAGAATFVDRPYIEDFCDGVNLWAMEYDATNSVLRVHKVALSTGVETIAVVNNIKLGAAAYFEGAFFAVGDYAVLFGQQLTGDKSQVMFFKLPDGNATTTFNFNVGAPGQTALSVGGGVQRYYTYPLIDTADLRGFHVSTLDGRKVCLFLTPNLAGTSTNPINVIEVDPVFTPGATPAAADVNGNVVTEKILGQTDGSAVWPLPRTSLAASITNMQLAAVSADGARLLTVNSASPFDALLYSVSAKRQISAVVPVSGRITTVDMLSRINVAGAPMLAVVTTLSDKALIEVNV